MSKATDLFRTMFAKTTDFFKKVFTVDPTSKQGYINPLELAKVLVVTLASSGSAFTLTAVLVAIQASAAAIFPASQSAAIVTAIVACFLTVQKVLNDGKPAVPPSVVLVPPPDPKTITRPSIVIG